MSRTIGVLGLQGCIDPHLKIISHLGHTGYKVRSLDELTRIDALIMPGGESTTMIKLLERTGLWETLAKFGETHPVWGVCAGAILCAAKVENPTQQSLGLIDVLATRNHYGSQLESFEAKVEVTGFSTPLPAQFIRAPLLKPLCKKVATLAHHQGNSVLLRQDNILLSSFHVELGDDYRLHEYFFSF